MTSQIRKESSTFIAETIDETPAIVLQFPPRTGDTIDSAIINGITEVAVLINTGNTAQGITLMANICRAAIIGKGNNVNYRFNIILEQMDTTTKLNPMNTVFTQDSDNNFSKYITQMDAMPDRDMLLTVLYVVSDLSAPLTRHDNAVATSRSYLCARIRPALREDFFNFLAWL